jgi:hypothetical protein
MMRQLPIGSFGLLSLIALAGCVDVESPLDPDLAPLAAVYSGANITLNGSAYSNIDPGCSGPECEYPFFNDTATTEIYTFWDHVWVEYTVELSPGNWRVGLNVINYAGGGQGLGDDPEWYPQFMVATDQTSEIITIPASDTEVNHGFTYFNAPSHGWYTVRFTWLNDQAWCEGDPSCPGGPILDANIQINSVFFDKVGGKPVVPSVVLNAGNGNYYQAVADPGVTWSDARAAAATEFRGCIGHLATITSAAENAFIVETFEDALLGRYWLGGAQDAAFGEPAGGWGWITGEPFIYTNWAGGEPNNSIDAYPERIPPLPGEPEDFLHFHWFDASDPGRWNDIAENESFFVDGYVVEYDCPPNGSVTERVSGSGHFTSGGELRTFSFNARKYADGAVKGEWQQNNRALGAEEHGNVTCFAVEGHQVWLGGFAEKGTNAGEVGWTVVDNGEGAGSPPDQISLKWVRRPPGFASA